MDCFLIPLDFNSAFNLQELLTAEQKKKKKKKKKKKTLIYHKTWTLHAHLSSKADAYSELIFWAQFINVFKLSDEILNNKMIRFDVCFFLNMKQYIYIFNLSIENITGKHWLKIKTFNSFTATGDDNKLLQTA